MGTISQGYLEGSNVQVVEELIGLIKAQRSFEANSKFKSEKISLKQLIPNYGTKKKMPIIIPILYNSGAKAVIKNLW